MHLREFFPSSFFLQVCFSILDIFVPGETSSPGPLGKERCSCPVHLKVFAGCVCVFLGSSFCLHHCTSIVEAVWIAGLLLHLT